MSSSTPRLAMDYLVSSQAQKEVTHNAALNDMDYLVQTTVISQSLSMPPTSPSNGDVYIVSSSPTGAWASYASYIAAYYEGWKFKKPTTGWRVFSLSDNKYFMFNGSAWVALYGAYLDATFTWAPGNIASAGSVASAAITVTGAALGDFVQVAAPYDLSGITPFAYVQSVNTVNVRATNLTGAAVSLPSGVWRVRVTKA